MFAFNSAGIEPAVPQQPIPSGEYLVIIEEMELKNYQTTDQGQRVSVKLRVIEGPFTQRIVYANINLYHPNPQTAEIAQREMSALCAAVGRPAFNAPNEIFNIPFVAVVSMSRDTNNVKGFKPAPAQAPGAPVGMQPLAQPGGIQHAVESHSPGFAPPFGSQQAPAPAGVGSGQPAPPATQPPATSPPQAPGAGSVPGNPAPTVQQTHPFGPSANGALNTTVPLPDHLKRQ